MKIGHGRDDGDVRLARGRMASAALLAVLAAGCGPAADEVGPGGAVGSPAPQVQDAAPASPASPAPPDPGGAAPADAPLAAGLDFVLPALGGGQVVGAELAGRDVALWFWAPW